MRELVKVMKALSDPNRIKIIKMLEDKEMCVCEIRAILNLAQPTVSNHLKTLEGAGLVTSRKEKLWVNYRRAAGVDSAYAAAMLHHMGQWLTDDPEIKKIRLALPTVNRTDLCGK